MVTRLPIYKDFLHLILDELDKWAAEEGQLYLRIMYSAFFVSAYYGLLRIGEVAQGPHVILADDVRIGVNKRKLLYILRSSKTHDAGTGPQMVKISGTTAEPKYCPYTIVDRYLNRRPHAVSELEQFFVISDGSPVTPDQARNFLRTLIKRIGLWAELYNFHSFRSGRCGDLLKYGVSVETIKKIGRWKSNAIFKYFKD